MKRLALLSAAVIACTAFAVDERPALTIERKGEMLHIVGDAIPGGRVVIWYLEAYCRPGSANRDWTHTLIKHRTEIVSHSADKTRMELKCTLEDGVVVTHIIEAGSDEVDFRVTLHNPTDKPSVVHWAQPCMRVGNFTSGDKKSYIRKSFVFQNGRLQRMPTQDWATDALYTPGQVWIAPGIDPHDANPRPLNPHRPDNGLIGCFSEDESMILAMAWDPWHELFQGVITCLHADFAIGGLKPGETKTARGKVYIVPNDVDALLERYQEDLGENEK